MGDTAATRQKQLLLTSHSRGLWRTPEPAEATNRHLCSL